MQYVRASELKYLGIMRNNTNLLYSLSVYIKEYISLEALNFNVKTYNLVYN